MNRGIGLAQHLPVQAAHHDGVLPQHQRLEFVLDQCRQRIRCARNTAKVRRAFAADPLVGSQTDLHRPGAGQFLQGICNRRGIRNLSSTTSAQSRRSNRSSRKGT